MPLIFTLLEGALLLQALLSAAVCNSIALMIKSPVPHWIACEISPARRCRVKSLPSARFLFFAVLMAFFKQTKHRGNGSEPWNGMGKEPLAESWREQGTGTVREWDWGGSGQVSCVWCGFSSFLFQVWVGKAANCVIYVYKLIHTW